MNRLFAVLLAVAAFSACADQAPVSGPGTMTATLKSPNGSEGAAIVELVGAGIGSVSAAGGTEVWSDAGDDGVRIVLVDRDGGDLSFRVAVPDTTAPPAYVIHEVAGTDDALRDVATYTLEFVR